MSSVLTSSTEQWVLATTSTFTPNVPVHLKSPITALPPKESLQEKNAHINDHDKGELQTNFFSRGVALFNETGAVGHVRFHACVCALQQRTTTAMSIACVPAPKDVKNSPAILCLIFLVCFLRVHWQLHIDKTRRDHHQSFC